MIADEQQYAVTTTWVARCVASLEKLQALPDTEPHLAQRIAGTRSQLEVLRREIAMWEAGIREEVPPSPDAPELHAGPHDRAGASVRLKRAEIANIDRQVGIALDRIADWRRHRAWLEREIAELDALPAGADPVEAAAIDPDPVPIEEAVRAG